ncbi:MAG: hypothetical protein GWP33_08470 [Alphaproteobacteria bacterium]|nr:hypothetical protein [Alphaproteobacteria bacterium]
MSKKSWLGDPILDKMFQVVIRLAGELYVTKDRLATLESIIEEKELLDLSEMDTYAESAENNMRLSEQRDTYIANILEPLTKTD